MTDEQGRTIETGDVLQFHGDHDMFAGCFIVVQETADWGVRLGYVAIPTARGEPPRLAFCRPKWADVEYVGRATWVQP